MSDYTDYWDEDRPEVKESNGCLWFIIVLILIGGLGIALINGNCPTSHKKPVEQIQTK